MKTFEQWLGMDYKIFRNGLIKKGFDFVEIRKRCMQQEDRYNEYLEHMAKKNKLNKSVFKKS